MDAGGLALGVAGLYGACVDILERVGSFKSRGLDSAAIIAKFNGYKLKFNIWAHDIGISKHGPAPVHHSALDKPEIRSQVKEILQSIYNLISEVEKKKSSLHISGLPSRSESDWPNQQNATSNLPHVRKRDGIKWSFGSKDKVTSWVDLFADLVGLLCELVRQGNDAPENNETVETIKGQLSQLIENYRQNDSLFKMRAYHEWLDTPSIDHRFDQYISNCLEGTCEWFFERPDYQDWLSTNFEKNNAKVFLLNGHAAFGKTTLTSKIVAKLHQSSVEQDKIADFFATSHASGSGQPHGIIRSWISQLAEQRTDIFDVIENYINGTGRATGRVASQAEIWHLFKAILQTISGCTFVLDGLDEYTDHRTEFLYKLQDAIDGTHTRVLISSREETEIYSAFQSHIPKNPSPDVTKFKIALSDNEADIQLYARHVTDTQLPRKSPEVREEIASALASKSEGLFLWIKLQQPRLSGGKSPKDLRRIVNNMPSGLNTIYDRHWETILRQDPDDRAKAICILRWAAFAVKPLTLAQLADALLLRPDDPDYEFDLENRPEMIDEEYVDKEIKAFCNCFIEIRGGIDSQSLASRTLHLAHPSVREYLLRKLPLPSGEVGNEQLHRMVLSKSCLFFVSRLDLWYAYFAPERIIKRRIDEVRLFLELRSCLLMISRPCFLFYASIYWFEYITPRRVKEDNELLEMLNSFLQTDKWAFTLWSRCYEQLPQEEPTLATTGNSMYYAAFFGLIPTMLHIKENEDPDLNFVGGYYGTALQAACKSGSNEAVSLLLDWQVDVNIWGGSFGTALKASIWRRDENLAELLVQHGASPNLPVPENEPESKTKRRSSSFLATSFFLSLPPLHLAASGGQVQIMKILFEAGANIESVDEFLCTATHWAAFQGQTQALEFLIQKNANIEAVEHEERTPLQVAVSQGQLQNVKILLEVGANIEACSKFETTPLHEAAIHGQTQALEFLIQKNANIEAIEYQGVTPLLFATTQGQVQCMKVLLEAGANIGARGIGGSTALHVAAHNGQTQAVELLLKNRANIRAVNKEGVNALHYAAYNGYVETAALLIEEGININDMTGSGFTALDIALAGDHKDVVDLLLKHGAVARRVCMLVSSAEQKFVLITKNPHIS